MEDAGEGFFYIVSKKNGRVVALDNGGNGNNAIVYNKIASANDQKWALQQAGESYFYLINKKTGKALDVDNAGLDNRAKIHQWDINGTDAQMWGFEAVVV